MKLLIVSLVVIPVLAQIPSVPCVSPGSSRCECLHAGAGSKGRASSEPWTTNRSRQRRDRQAVGLTRMGTESRGRRLFPWKRVSYGTRTR